MKKKIETGKEFLSKSTSKLQSIQGNLHFFTFQCTITCPSSFLPAVLAQKLKDPMRLLINLSMILITLNNLNVNVLISTYSADCRSLDIVTKSCSEQMGTQCSNPKRLWSSLGSAISSQSSICFVLTHHYLHQIYT